MNGLVDVYLCVPSRILSHKEQLDQSAIVVYFSVGDSIFQRMSTSILGNLNQSLPDMIILSFLILEGNKQA